MARAQGARAQMALAFETVYGTPPASGYTRMPFASTSLGAAAAAARLGAARLRPRSRCAPVKDAVTADGDVVVPIDAAAFGFWLKAVFGEPTPPAPAPGRTSSAPAAGRCRRMSIETAMPEVPRFAMYSGCVLDQLSWQMQRSGLLTATAKLVAQGETVGDDHRRRHAGRAGAEALRPLQRRDHPQRHGARQRRLGRDHLRQQPRPHRDDPQRRPHRRRRSVDRRAHRPGRGALRRPGAGRTRRSPATPASSSSPTRCPRARASPSPRTPSTCRGRGSRSPARRACRRPSTGRRRRDATRRPHGTAILVNDVDADYLEDPCSD